MNTIPYDPSKLHTENEKTVNTCCLLGGPDHLCDPSKKPQNITYENWCDNVANQTPCPENTLAENWTENEACNPSMIYYCQLGTNLFDENVCNQWVVDFQPSGIPPYTKTSGDVDVVLKNVCNRPENKDRTECACILATQNIAKQFPTTQTIPAQCLLNVCNGNNPGVFKLHNQFEPCNYVYCNLDLDNVNIVANNPKVFNSQIIQNCGNSTSTTQTPNSNTPIDIHSKTTANIPGNTPSYTNVGQSTSTTSTATPQFLGINIWYWVGIIAGILICHYYINFY